MQGIFSVFALKVIGIKTLFVYNEGIGKNTGMAGFLFIANSDGIRKMENGFFDQQACRRLKNFSNLTWRGSKMTDKETMEYLSAFSPETLLAEKNNGFAIRDVDFGLIEELREKSLSEDIIKIILYYVLRRGYGLRFEEVRDMAEKCVKRNITTIQEAFNLTVEEDFHWKSQKEMRKIKRKLMEPSRY
jgi:replication initiation and membrane attachment protein DnaB